MIVIEFLTALAMGLLVLVLVSAGFRRRGPWTRRSPGEGLIWFLVIVVLGAWAVGTWATPVGPVYSGVAWTPFLVGAVVFGLLLAAASAPYPPASTTAVEAEAEAAVAVGGFFWLLVVVLLVTIGFGVLL